MSSTVATLRRPASGAASHVPTRVLAIVVALHGVAHFAGTSDSLGKAAGHESVDYLMGGWTVSDPTLLRVFGVLWVLLGVAFILAAVAVWARRPGWPHMLAAVSLASLALVAVALWSSVVGVVIDLALLAVAVRVGALRRSEARR